MIYHLILPDDWAAAQAAGVYEPPSLSAENFIHFSTREQVVGTANRFYSQHNQMLLLAVDDTKLGDMLKFEDLYIHGALFPHLYGPLDLNQVIAVYELAKSDSGAFELPGSL